MSGAGGLILLGVALVVAGGASQLFLNPPSRTPGHRLLPHWEEGLIYSLLLGPFILFLLGKMGFRMSITTLLVLVLAALLGGWMLRFRVKR
ncbi:MAG: hypothetical protein Q8P05_03375 [Candidatus Diapherotrites archaeon]|nr:hypothetical protein [Candidatus Diapherotrites archaeon]